MLQDQWKIPGVDLGILNPLTPHHQTSKLAPDSTTQLEVSQISD